MIEVPIGLFSKQEYIVSKEDTAINQKSGEVKVLGTPRLLAMMEEVSFKSVSLPEGYVSVGFLMNIQHLKPSFIGEKVIIESTLIKQDNKKLIFSIICKNDKGEEIGKGECTRVIVEKVKFEQKETR